jgi:hypothetical protein
MLADVVIVEGAINLLIAITILNVLRVGNTIGPKLVNIVNPSVLKIPKTHHSELIPTP